MSETAGTTIVGRLITQRVNLLDVVRQIDLAIAAFGADTNANGAAPTNGKGPGRGGWQRTASPAKLARWKRRMAARRQPVQPEAVPHL